MLGFSPPHLPLPHLPLPILALDSCDIQGNFSAFGGSPIECSLHLHAEGSHTTGGTCPLELLEGSSGGPTKKSR